MVSRKISAVAQYRLFTTAELSSVLIMMKNYGNGYPKCNEETR